MTTDTYKIDTEYWARYYKAANRSIPDLTFVIKYNIDGATYTNVSGSPRKLPVGRKAEDIKNNESYTISGVEFEDVVLNNTDRYRRISKEAYIKALISGQLYDD